MNARILRKSLLAVLAAAGLDFAALATTAELSTAVFSTALLPVGSAFAEEVEDAPASNYVASPTEDGSAYSETDALGGTTGDGAPMEGTRSIPGRDEQIIYGPPRFLENIPDINSSGPLFVPVPDRWRQLYKGKWYDPYNQNELKGDIPMWGEPGHEIFLELNAVSDTLVERRVLPNPVGGASTASSGSTDTFGDGNQTAIVQNFLLSASIIKGNTTFKPPDYEIRIAPVLQINHVRAQETGVLRADPARDETRDDFHIGFQELFIDKHLGNLTDRYDFISARVGIQRFISDFRGFIFASDEPGVRLFGNYDNNLWQYNLAWFSRLDKDVNSGLNTNFEMRKENVYIANLYRQDQPTLGHTLQGSLIYREDRASDGDLVFDSNGFVNRPSPIGDMRQKNVYSTYFGLNGDGHIGRVNMTESIYGVIGSESHNQIAQRSTDIEAMMAAYEASYDIDFIRLRASVFYASGDKDPFDDKAQGFDAIFDNPNFAGGDLSFFQRQGIPLIGGGGVNVTNRNSLLASFRPGKELGQSNFVNPGLRLYNVGVDIEVTPKLKLITNGSFLQFDRPAALRAVRQDGSIDRDIGFDISAGFLYRPFLNNNVQFRGGTAALIAGDGTKNLFNDDVLYDFFTNIIFVY